MIKVLLTVLAVMVAFPVHAEPQKETAIFAGGCFWCVESDFDKVKGVLETVSGYTGGTEPNPTYETYHDKGEGIVPHVEALQVTYDPAKTDYKTLVHYYFRHIDPLDNGGQFCDRGASYRPVIFTANDDQKAIAEAEKAIAAKELGQAVLVEILDANTFWPAEGYHQDYHTKNAIRYNLYRLNCGRDARVKKVWGGR